ncbi:unnamed protein product [Sphagnum tenellum]
MNILFARWLVPAEYGLFVVSFSAYLFMTVIHWGAFLEPLLILSAQIDGDRRRPYVHALGKIHLLLIGTAITIASIGFGVSSYFGHINIGYGLIGAGVGGTFMVTLLTARRLCLVFLSPKVSAIIGLLYFIGVLSTGSLIDRSQLTWFTLWEITGGWSLICSFIIFWLVRRNTNGSVPYPLRQLLAFQSQYAPGAIISSACNWISFDGVLLLLSSMAGLAAVAETKAVFTIANPLLQINLVMHASWLVMFAEQNGRIKILRIMGLYSAGTVVAVLLLGSIARPLTDYLYAGRYIDASWQLPFFVAALGLSGLASILTSLFKSQGRLWYGFCPNIVGAIVAVAGAFIFIPTYGQPGAIYSILVGCCTTLGLSAVLYRFAGER